MKAERIGFYQDMTPIMSQYGQVGEVTIHCRCGLVVKTSSIEYFCGNCGFKLIDPCSHTGAAHKVYDFREER